MFRRCSQVIVALSLIALTPLSGAKAQTLSAAQRVAQFGLSEIRGIAYIPGPALTGCLSAIKHRDDPPSYAECYGPNGPVSIPVDPMFNAKSVLPYYLGELLTYYTNKSRYCYQPGCHGLSSQYTIYYDSDFYNADFAPPWGKTSSDGQARDDLGRYKAELNVNFIHLYDWNSNADAVYRNHQPFLDYASSLGLRVTIPISNYTYGLMCSGGNWQATIRGVFKDVYKNGSTPHSAAGMLKIFNEYDVSNCRNAQYVAQAALYWKQLEDGANVPDAQRLPIIFPVTWSIQNGIPGGAVLSAFNAIKNNPDLGLAFWQARVVYATNPFNPGTEVYNWITTALPSWFQQHGIPSNTPVMFTEYGRSSDQSTPPNQAGQAEYVKGQFEAMYTNGKPKPNYFLGATAFVNEYRFWLDPAEPNFALTDFNKGGGTWNKPTAMYVHHQRYKNPNGGGALWDAYYQVDPQQPRPAYCEIAKVFLATVQPCP